MRYQRESVYTGPVPWRIFGHAVEGGVLTPEVLQAAGLAWAVAKVELFERAADGSFVEVPEIYGVRRSDLGRSFAKVAVGEKYTPVQNDALMGISSALAQVGGLTWEHAGSLYGGRRVWALGRAPGAYETRPGDVKLPYCLAYNSHDGSSNLELLFLQMRPFCWNVRRMARNRQTSVKLRHTASVEARLKEAVKALDVMAKAFEEARIEEQRLAEQRMSLEQFLTFAMELLDITGDEKGGAKTMAERKVEDLAVNFQRGLGTKGETREDALNAVTEWIDHQHNRAAKARAAGLGIGGFESALFSNGSRVKEKARALLAR